MTLTRGTSIRSRWPPPLPKRLAKYAESGWLTATWGLVAVVGVLGRALGLDYEVWPTGTFIVISAGLLAALLRVWALTDRQRHLLELQKLRDAVLRIGQRQYASFRENCVSRFSVSPSGQDKVDLFHQSWSTGTQDVHWRHKEFGVRHHARELGMSYDEPVITSANERIADSIVLPERDKLHFFVFFHPPINNMELEPVEWTISFTWPGLWDSFRETGSDQGRFQLDHEASGERIEIVLPAELENKPTEISSRAPNVGIPGSTKLANGDQELTWTIDDPDRQAHTYWLKTSDGKRPRFNKASRERAI